MQTIRYNEIVPNSNINSPMINNEEECVPIRYAKCTFLNIVYGLFMDLDEVPDCDLNTSCNKFTIPPQLVSIPDGKSSQMNYDISPQQEISINFSSFGMERLLYFILQAKCGDFLYKFDTCNSWVKARTIFQDLTDFRICCDDGFNFLHKPVYDNTPFPFHQSITLKNYFPKEGLFIKPDLKIKNIRVYMIAVGL